MAVAAETLQPWRTVVTIEPTERQQMEATAMASAHRQRREKLAHEARQIAGKRRATTTAARSRGEVEVIKGSALNQSCARWRWRSLSVRARAETDTRRASPYDLTQVGGHRRGHTQGPSRDGAAFRGSRVWWSWRWWH